MVLSKAHYWPSEIFLCGREGGQRSQAPVPGQNPSVISDHVGPHTQSNQMKAISEQYHQDVVESKQVWGLELNGSSEPSN